MIDLLLLFSFSSLCRLQEFAVATYGAVGGETLANVIHAPILCKTNTTFGKLLKKICAAYLLDGCVVLARDGTTVLKGACSAGCLKLPVMPSLKMKFVFVSCDLELVFVFVSLYFDLDLQFEFEFWS
jgi:hypothetical protein